MDHTQGISTEPYVMFSRSGSLFLCHMALWTKSEERRGEDQEMVN